ncbi:S1/P1 nuclease [Longimicrobium sp.]|uniref:S1/P1 nuclease n=1 Tax=Longimicrobium sp. TaxID=2029185 RepID=UPI002CD5C5DA|nr:S1/P1 nuclease [Longimicrobium sp.]HSU16852.1 S1/P1 nuclease [Longimicrobium sp.]
MKRTLMLPVALAFVTLTARPAWAWDGFGHQLVARIAWENMTPQARGRAIAVLQGAAQDTRLLQGFGTGTLTPQQQVRLFMAGATWPDDVRPPDSRGAKYHVRDRHFTDLFWRQSYDFGPFHDDSRPPAGDLLNDFAGLRTQVTGPDHEQAAVALAWLLHLVGDIHQPLHASGRITPSEPDGDQGGNLYKLEHITADRQRTLHSVWDNIITSNARRLPGEADDAFMTRIATETMHRHPRSEFAAEMGQTDVSQWARASVHLAQRRVYRAPLHRNQAASTTYRNAAFHAADPRIALAGYRLADLLNQVLGS